MFVLNTIRDGQRVAVWDKQGRVEIVDGPKRLFLWGKTVQWLERYSAQADQYLQVVFQDGHCDNISGPVAIWLDPVKHKSIEVTKALPIDSHEAVVIYRQGTENVQRRVLKGPAVYVPSENEWLHRFSWHGADPNNQRRKKPSVLNFSKLRVIPDQMYFDVEEVRTADDALLTVRLMVFFELKDIEKMLEQTHDPIADFINALSADVIDFAGGLNFEKFKQATEMLNEMETYKNMVRRAERIGYAINKVVYRGYQAGDKLQVMHDNAIETRTHLKLESETEEQAQELADLKLQREAQRTETQQQMEQQQTEHGILMEKLTHNEKIRCQKEEQNAELESIRQQNQMELEHQQTVTENELAVKKKQYEIEQEHLQVTNQEKVNYLKGVKEMDVDLTRYLVAQYQNPDKLIRIAEGQKTQLHLHN